MGLGFLDEHMLASIRDSLSYVSDNHAPALFEQRVVVVFDSTVNIAYGGDSAGAALAISAMSRSSGIVPSPDVCMTGSIRSFGDIRPVGGIPQKTKSALKRDFRIMLAPAGNEGSFASMPYHQKIGTCQIILGMTMNDYLPFAMPAFENVDTAPRKSLKAYAMAYHLFLAGEPNKSLECCKIALTHCPMHYSAKALESVLQITGASPKELPESVKNYLNN